MPSKNLKIIATTKTPEKFEYAYLLFMQGLQHKDICKKVGCSPATLKSWKDTGKWEEKRAARTISLDDLMQKALHRINELLDNEKSFNADSFAKSVKQLKELKATNTIDDHINTFMSFQDFLITQRVNYKEITDDLIKAITRLQDLFIQYRLGHGKIG